jgi:hypothetical protein
MPPDVTALGRPPSGPPPPASAIVIVPTAAAAAITIVLVAFVAFITFVAFVAFVAPRSSDREGRERWCSGHRREGPLRGSCHCLHSSCCCMQRCWRWGEGNHDNDGNNDDGDGNDRRCRSSRHPTPFPSSLSSSLQSSVRDLIRSALGWMPFFRGIGAALPMTMSLMALLLMMLRVLGSPPSPAKPQQWRRHWHWRRRGMHFATITTASRMLWSGLTARWSGGDGGVICR